MDKNVKEHCKNPREDANPISITCFAWLWKTFRTGYARDLELTDLYSPLDSHASRFLGDKLEEKWQEEEYLSKEKSQYKPSLWKALAKCFGTEIILVGLVQIVMEFLIILPQPIALSKLLKYFKKNSTMSLNDALIWAGVFTFLNIIKCPFYHHTFHSMIHLGMKARIASCSLIYRKVLRTSKSSDTDASAGQTVNLLSNDVNSLDYALPFFHYIWIAPVQLIITAFIMYEEINLTALTGIVLYVLIIPLQGLIGRCIPNLACKIALKTDQRLRLMNEIISGVQLIKMYAWEKPFSRLIEKTRKEEISAIRKNIYLDFVSMAFESYVPRLCIFVTIVTYALQGNAISGEMVFMISAFYNNIKFALGIAFPLAIQHLANAAASIKRIEKFMELDEVQQPTSKGIRKNCNGFYYKIPSPIKSKIAVSLKNATARWCAGSSDDNLKNINFLAKHGSLTAVVGQVGAGKSNLFNAILQELPLISGSLEVNGKLAYVSQEPWIFASSIRQNILFGEPMVKKRYDEVVRVCQLEKDFRMFLHKDQTIIGEKGVNLSGGQRARINLARAIYAEADIYLLDDPLSAVDAHVGRSLFEECICDHLKGKTRILVTHQLQYLNSVDNIYVLSNGTIKAEGTFETLRNSDLDFLSVLQTTSGEDQNIDDENDNQKSLIPEEIKERDVTSEDVREEEAEHRTVGRVSSQIYFSYFKAVGSSVFVFLIFILLIVQKIVEFGVDYSLARWVDVEEPLSHFGSANNAHIGREYSSRLYYIFVYAGLMAGTIFFVYIKTFAHFEMCLMSSKKLHTSVFYSIIRAPMSFFHSNPSGRIINRFSKDIGLVDKYLPFAMKDVLEIFVFLIVVITMAIIINYWLLIPTIVTGFIFYFLRSIYMKTGRSIKRLEAITRSPVFSHLNATIQGLATIRGFKTQQLLTKEFDNHQDIHSGSWFLFFSCARAFALYLELICAINVGIVVYLSVLFANQTAIGQVGLIVTQYIILSTMLQWGMVQTAELENHMTSVERILEYTKIQSEPSLESGPDNKLPEKWPKKGRVEFENVSLKYTIGGEFVLKNLNFVIEPKEKVGIVGRTGAGKSSLISALFRLANMEGEIYIDGIPIGNLGLHDLRSNITIIPQEPFLFAGTLRENLDPFKEFSDDVLWEALSEVELKDALGDNGLYGKVSDGGSNFSVGQRQLLCLARAIVRNNKILVLDEATANVDPQTDELVQKTIRRKFKDCTVLIIAHRLNTVMDCDRLIIMDGGHVSEFAHPFLLLQNKKGYLYKTVQRTGTRMADILTKMAERSFQNKHESKTDHGSI